MGERTLRRFIVSVIYASIAVDSLADLPIIVPTRTAIVSVLDLPSEFLFTNDNAGTCFGGLLGFHMGSESCGFLM